MTGITTLVGGLVLVAVIAAVTILTATGHLSEQTVAALLGVVLGHVGTVSAINMNNTNKP